MKFNYVKFKNFLSYGEEIQTIDLSESGTTLVAGYNEKDGGSNGSGKSSAIVDSVVYGLFGQTTKGLKAEEVINNKNKKDCFIEIAFEINKDLYKVRRYRAHTQFDNSLLLEKNGTDISAEKIRDTQRLIEDIIKISFKSFVRSIVLSQEKMAGFAENDPIERRKIIENLLMYDFISKYHKMTKEILRTIKPEIISLSRTIEDKKESIKTLTSNMLSYIEKWEAAEDNKQQRIEYLITELAEWKEINPQEELDIRAKLRELKSAKESIVYKKESYEENLVTTRSDIKKLKIKLDNKTKEIDEINEDPGKCPVCQNDIDNHLLKEYLDKRLAEQNEIKDLIRLYEDNVKEYAEKANKYLIKIEKITRSISELNEKTASDLSDEEVQNLHGKITSAESEVNILKSQLGGKIEDNEYIQETQKEIDEIKLKVKKIRKKIKLLEKEQVYYEWWRDALGNSPSSMKAFCVNHVLMSLNKYIKYYLNFFGYDITYELNSELEDVIIKDDEQLSFNQLSGGEKRSVEISLVFSLYEIVRLKMPDNINIIVLDEMLSNYLDDIRITGALELLSELEERGLSIFVIDHRNLIKENLDCRTIKVIKDKQGISRLELDK